MVDNHTEMFVISGPIEYSQFHTGQQWTKQSHYVELPESRVNADLR